MNLRERQRGTVYEFPPYHARINYPRLLCILVRRLSSFLTLSYVGRSGGGGGGGLMRNGADYVALKCIVPENLSLSL